MALPVLLQPAPRFGNFFPGPNGDVIESLRRLASGAAPGAVWLHGAPASGKSHLLAAAIHEADGGVLLSLRDCALDQLADARPGLLAVDDVEAGLARPGAELALMRAIDARRASGRSLLLAAVVPPPRLGAVLPDLRTRCEGLLRLGLRPLREDDRRALLDLHAQARGLSLAPDAANWLLVHLRRDPGSLIEALDRLDRAALTEQRRPTLPFVQKVLQPAPVPAPGQTASG